MNSTERDSGHASDSASLDTPEMRVLPASTVRPPREALSSELGKVRAEAEKKLADELARVRASANEALAEQLQRTGEGEQAIA